MKLKLFYSYSHEDVEIRDRMEKSIALLRRNYNIIEWYDRKIVPGTKWQEKIYKELENSNLIIFLVSQSFLASEACLEEWELAKKQADEEPNKRLIIIVIKPCPWRDCDEMSNYQALPEGIKPISTWNDHDKAWLNVYEGLKETIEEIQSTFTVKKDFVQEISRIEFCSNSEDRLEFDNLFVFPNLEYNSLTSNRTEKLKTIQSFTKHKKIVLVGDELSGKSKFLAYLFKDLSNNDKPVILFDFNEIKHKQASDELYQFKYEQCYEGDYIAWKAQENKTLLLDNLTNHKSFQSHLEYITENYSSIIISITRDVYDAFFKDDKRLSEFHLVVIKPLGLAKQEILIRNWLAYGKKLERIEDGYVDQIENSVNEIIQNDRIIPRYPFFVLSILQTYEAFMPRDVKITAYGHCYYALIIANLIKSGVDQRDDALNSCMNFCANLSFEMFNNGKHLKIKKTDFNSFVERYTDKIIIEKSNINRILHQSGLIKESDQYYEFSLPYSFYFFLGQYLAKNYKDNKGLLSELVKQSYQNNNALILIFTIHHCQDIDLIEEILIQTECALDRHDPAKLDGDETSIMMELLSSMPDKVKLGSDVKSERKRLREIQDEYNEDIESNSEDVDYKGEMSDLFLVLKNIEILSQILKNKYGELNKSQVKELIETICDSGLRMIKALTINSEQLEELSGFVVKSLESDHKGAIKPEDIKKAIISRMILMAVGIIEKIIQSICKNEIREIVKLIKDEKSTPAFDLIYYLFMLDSSERFTDANRVLLQELVEKYSKEKMFFLHKILSLRTQIYFNTHDVNAPIKQSVSSLLGIQYKPG